MLNLVFLVSALVGWTTLFKLVQWKWSLTTTPASHAIAFAHGFFASRSSEYVIYMEKLWRVEKFGEDNTPLQDAILTVSLAYFIYDLVICFIIKETVLIKTHHFLAVLIVAATISESYSGPEVIVSLWYGEFTNVFINLRYFFQNQDRYRGSSVAFVNDVFFAVFFLFLRFVVGTYVIYCILTLGKSLPMVQVGSILFIGVNILMGKIIVVESLKVLFPSSKPKTS